MEDRRMAKMAAICVGGMTVLATAILAPDGRMWLALGAGALSLLGILVVRKTHLRRG